MAGDTTIRAIIKLLVEGGHIPKEVAKNLTDVGKAGKQAQKDLAGTGGAVKELNSLLGQYLSAAAIGAFVKSSITDFADLDRSFHALGFTMKQTGVGGAEDLRRARTELENIALGGGPLVAQTVPALQKFVTMTHDTDNALAAVKLASDVSESGITDFGSAAQGVAALLQGKVKVAATQFGIDLTDSSGKAKTNAELIKEIGKTYSGLGDEFNDSANDLDKLNATWEQTKQTVGAGFAPMLKVVDSTLFHLIGGFKDLGAIVGAFFSAAIDSATAFSKAGAAAFDFKKLFTDPSGYWQAIKTNAKEASAQVADDFGYAWDQIVKDHTRATGDIVKNDKGMRGLLTQAGKATATEDAKAAAEAEAKKSEVVHKNLQDLLQAQIAAAKEGSDERLALELALIDDQEKAAIEAAKRTGVAVSDIEKGYALQRAAKEKEYATARAEADYQSQSDALRAGADLFAEGSQQRLNAELVMLDREYLHQIENYKGTVEGKKSIDAAYLASRYLKTLEYDRAESVKEMQDHLTLLQAQADADKAAHDIRLELAQEGAENVFRVKRENLDQEQAYELSILDAEYTADWKAANDRGESTLAVDFLYIQKRLALLRRFGLAGLQVTKDEVTSKREAGIAIMQASIGFARTAFAQNKAVMIATAVADLALGIMNIWKTWGDNPWVAGALTALISATAAVNIQKIKGAQPSGGGFDDPVNDAAAYRGGRKWAKDFVDHTETGFSDGLKRARDEGRGPIAAARGAASPVAMLGGAKFSDAGVAQLGQTFRTVMHEKSETHSTDRIVEAIKEVATAPAAKTGDTHFDQSLHIHGNVLAGDAGARELSRIVRRGDRLDSNRSIG